MTRDEAIETVIKAIEEEVRAVSNAYRDMPKPEEPKP